MSKRKNPQISLHTRFSTDKALLREDIHMYWKIRNISKSRKIRVIGYHCPFYKNGEKMGAFTRQKGIWLQDEVIVRNAHVETVLWPKESRTFYWYPVTPDYYGIDSPGLWSFKLKIFYQVLGEDNIKSISAKKSKIRIRTKSDSTSDFIRYTNNTNWLQNELGLKQVNLLFSNESGFQSPESVSLEKGWDFVLVVSKSRIEKLDVVESIEKLNQARQVYGDQYGREVRTILIAYEFTNRSVIIAEEKEIELFKYVYSQRSGTQHRKLLRYRPRGMSSDYNFEDISERLTKINELGWIRTSARGSSGAGRTLEGLLGISQANVSLLDIGAIELKVVTRPSFITLFTKTPRQLSSMLFEKEPENDTSAQKVFVSLSSVVNRTGWKLNLTSDRIEFMRNGKVLAEEQLKDLNSRFTTKLKQTILVEADSKMEIGGSRLYRYSEATYLSKPDFDGFTKLMKDGHVKVEIRMRRTEKGVVRDHGTAYRIDAKKIKLLFSNRQKIM